MNQEDARRLVERGYDAMAEQYLASKDQEDPHFLAALKSLSVGLPQGAPVLDLGCGAGLPATRFLARRGFAVTGVDVSARQLELARLHVPEAAAFHRADMADEQALDIAPASFAAVVALYSIIHVPREGQPALLSRVRRWLRPGGLFLATWAVRAWEGEEPDWEGWGATMWWSHHGADTNLRMLADAGFDVDWQQTVTSGGTSGAETWLWVMAALR